MNRVVGIQGFIAPIGDCSIHKGIPVVITARPKVAELVFQLYGRPLHPELFVIHQSRRVKRGNYEAKIEITSAGHLVTWRYGGLTLTEVAAAANNPLPVKRRLMSHKLKGRSSDSLECRGGVKYKVDFQLETVEPEIFRYFQQELVEDSLRQGMLHRFDSGGRLAFGAMSYVNIETLDRELTVQAFHTFPADCAIVKSRSSFQLP